jgi:hypothetical protein
LATITPTVFCGIFNLLFIFYIAQKCKSWQQLQPLYFVAFLKASEYKNKHNLQTAISTTEEIIK